MIELTDEQGKAIKAILSWWADRYKIFPCRPFKLAGLAGTGKSTLVPFIIDALGIDIGSIAFCAYTGKAAMVLRQKGIPASTIHKLIYKPVEDKAGKVHFVKKHMLDYGTKLIIVDESSMVGTQIQKDLESYGIPILYIGDHGQLPPVSKDLSDIMMKPDFRLETIHRQALDNPIIYIAHKARIGEQIKLGTYGNKVMKIMHKKLDDDMLWKATQLLCGRNNTRRNLNLKFRTKLGYQDISEYPVVNDKLICLKNSSESGLINGMIGTCTYYDSKEHDLTFETDYGEAFAGFPVAHEIFTSAQPVKYEKGIEQFDYGYAITVHKSQGSQFNKVLLFEEFLGNDWDLHKRWLYTGITRAVDKLIIVS